ncbi:hypothetical protein HHE02_14210 [Helicobacter heilmannii]|uniref:hypothetical protein n=1 Tax=Helicobacter heilmannii TaxID=35817 RepID=UPI0006A08845|nr:hypothetical protein [Helicobacter heilmannii]CRF48111.1 hypothetical protein HHE02_14210 [Helicobacter heilmannii]
MQLYNKVQELLEANKQTRQESIALLEQARTTLITHVDARFKTAMESLDAKIAQRVREQMQAARVDANLPQILERKTEEKLQELQAGIQAQALSGLINGVHKRQLEERLSAAMQSALQEKLSQMANHYGQEALSQMHMSARALQEDFYSQDKPALLEDLKEQIKLDTQGVLSKAGQSLEKKSRQLLADTKQKAQLGFNMLKSAALQEFKAGLTEDLEELKATLYGQFEEIKEEAKQEMQAAALLVQEEGRGSFEEALGQEMTVFVEKTQGFMDLLHQRLSDVLEQDFTEPLRLALDRLDTQFLHEKREGFFGQVEKDLDIILNEHLDSTTPPRFRFLAKQFFEESNNMRLFREMQLEAQLHLSALIQSNALKILEEESAYLRHKKLEELEFNNKVRMGLKRQELIKKGIIEVQEVKKKGTKAHLWDR